METRNAVVPESRVCCFTRPYAVDGDVRVEVRIGGLGILLLDGCKYRWPCRGYVGSTAVLLDCSRGHGMAEPGAIPLPATAPFRRIEARKKGRGASHAVSRLSCGVER